MVARIRWRNGADTRVVYRDTHIYAARPWIGRYSALAAPFVVLTFNVRAPEPIRRAPGTAGTYVYHVYRPPSGDP